MKNFEPIADWWGKESNGFKDRVETEQAWKVDFKKIKEDATAKAQPHWTKAETLNNEASSLNQEIKGLRSSIKGEKKAVVRKKVENQIQELSGQIDKLAPAGQGRTGDR